MESSRSGLFWSRMLSGTVVVLLLLNVCLVSTAESEIGQTWVQTSTADWPPIQPKEKLFFYHGHYESGPLFGMNQNLKDITIAPGTDLELAFNYWASQAGSLFHSKTKSQPVNKNNTWTTVALDKLTLDELINFKFSNQDLFTFAFKDIKVKYMEQRLTENFESSSIHGYQSVLNHTNFASFEDADVKPKDAQFSEIAFGKSITIELVDDTKLDSVEFSYKHLPDTKIETFSFDCKTEEKQDDKIVVKCNSDAPKTPQSQTNTPPEKPKETPKDTPKPKTPAKPAETPKDTPKPKTPAKPAETPKNNSSNPVTPSKNNTNHAENQPKDPKTPVAPTKKDPNSQKIANKTKETHVPAFAEEEEQEEQESQETAEPKFKSITISLKSKTDLALVIWNLKVNGPKHRIVDEKSALVKSSQIYKIKISNSKDQTSFIQLPGNVPANSDVCYKLTKLTKTATEKIEIYFAFENLKSGIHFLTISEQERQFCINDYIALRNVDKFQLTFVINGVIAKDFGLLVTETEVEKDLALWSPGENDGKLTGWFYYNSIYDYSLEGPEEVIKSKVWACDVVTNCFPFEQKAKQFTLKTEYKNLLTNSPYIRIQIDDPTKSFKFSKNSALEVAKQFRTQLISKNEIKKPDAETIAKLEITSTTFKKTIPEASQNFSIVIPLDLIDLRAHQLITTIQMSNKDTKLKPFVRLGNILYNSGQSNAEVVSLPEKVQGIVKIKAMHFSTQSWFAVHPSVLQSKTSGKSIEIIFETINAGTQFELTFDVEKANLKSIEQEDSKVVVKYYSKTDKEHPIARIDTNKTNRLEAKKDGAIFTNWIRAAEESQLKNLELNVSLTLTIPSTAPNVNDIWNQTTLKDSIVIVRLITTKSSPIITQIDPKDFVISKNNKTITIEDDIGKLLKNNNGEINLGGSFRLSYVLTSHVKFPIDIQVKNFQVAAPKLNEEQNCQGPQLASLDCRFENNQCFGTLERDSGGKCKLTNTYRWVEKGCGSSIGCSDIFDRALATSSETASGSDPKYIPHQVKEKEDISTHYLKVNPPETRKDTEDFCVTFEYASKEKSLWANANETSSKAYSLEFVETGLDKDKRVVPKTGQKVCASHLSNAVQDVKAIYFRFEKTLIIDTDNYFMKKVESTVVSNTIQILPGIQWGDTVKSDNFIIFDSRWATPSKNVLNFTVPDLKKLKTDQGNSYVSFLRTKWLQVPGNAENFGQFRLGLHPSGDLDKDFYHISLNVNSPQETLISKSISSTDKELYDKKLHSLSYSQKGVKFYQLTIKLTLDLSKLDFKKKDETSAFSIAFQSFTINDPCVDETTSEITKQCDGKTRGKIATCKRNYDTFSSECDCNDQYTGKHCEINVYCKQLYESDPKKTNEAVCKEGGATCKESVDSYDCQCAKDSNWDVSVKKCIDKAVLCKENQNLVYTDGKASCVCIDDFVELKKNECTKYNPCLNEHRKARNIKEAKCADLNAVCNADSENDDPNAYICKCKTGFVNQFGLKTADSKCLHVKCDVEQNSCEQVCKPKDEKFECACFDNYSLDNGKCKLKDSKLESKCQSKSTPAPFVNGVGNCECIQGYIWTNSTSCVLNSDKSSYFGLKFQCTKAVQLVDTKPACVCDPKTEVLDTETRSCKTRTECSSKEAEKCKQEHNTNQCKVESGEPKCGCNENQVKYAANEKESTKWVCLDKCQLFTEVYKDQACSEDFQKCDDAKVKIEGFQNDIFVNGKSVISSKKASSPSHCACLMGFEANNGKCLPRKDPQVNVQIDFEVDKDPKLIQQYFDLLIQSKLFAKSIDRILCEKSKDTVSCSASFPSDKTQAKIMAMLKDACKPIEGSAGKCAYLLPVLPKVPKSKKSKRSVTGTYYDPSVRVTNILVQDEKKAPKIESVDICKTANPCNGFDFSLCQKIINTSHIECICDQTIFDVKSSKLESIPQTELKMSLQTCEKKNLCSQDQYKCQPDAKCTYDVAFDAGVNRYTANSFCSCGSGGNGTFTLPNRSLSCTQTCKNACGENFESCAQNIYDQKYTCLCKKGYEGAKCDSKTGANIFLYSTIAVSVVAVLAIIGLGIFYYKRRSR